MITIKHVQEGFSLIELMIATVVIGILLAISLPSYQNYTARTADNACLAEVKIYSAIAIAALANGETPVAASAKTCLSIDTAVNIATPITAIPNPPGKGSISCNLSNSGICVLTPGT